jgi:putative tricarboxylic transport membrane protein
MLVSQGEMSVFFQNKLVGGMTTLALLLLAWPMISWLIAKARSR